MLDEWDDDGNLACYHIPHMCTSDAAYIEEFVNDNGFSKNYESFDDEYWSYGYDFWYYEIDDNDLPWVDECDSDSDCADGLACITFNSMEDCCLECW